MSHFGCKTFHRYLRQQQHWLVILPHSGFCYTVLLHHFETSGTELFRNMSFYSVIIVVLCLLCISDLYWHYQYALTKRPHLNLSCPQCLSFYLSYAKRQVFLQSLCNGDVHTYCTRARMHTGMCARTNTTLTSKEFSGLHTNTHSSLQRRMLFSVYNSKH